jgi:hypothetical protein
VTLYQVQVPIGGLPINLVLVGNKETGKVVFVKVAEVGVIVENFEDGKVAATFWNDCFHLRDGELEEDFDYDTIHDYKNIPLMLRWLQQQNLQQPQ